MNTTSKDLKPGDIMFGPIGGFVPGFLPVGIGQAALFLSRRWWRTVNDIPQWFYIRHAGIVGQKGDALTIIQAMPHGAEEIPLDPTKHLTGEHVYFRPDYEADGVWPTDVAKSARDYVGTPYGFLTYLKLAASVLRMRWTERLLCRLISSRRDMICSQIVDQALADAGYHVFDDGRLPQDVVPAELFNALYDGPGWVIVPGHPTRGRWTHTFDV